MEHHGTTRLISDCHPKEALSANVRLYVGVTENMLLPPVLVMCVSMIQFPERPTFSDANTYYYS